MAEGKDRKRNNIRAMRSTGPSSLMIARTSFLCLFSSSFLLVNVVADDNGYYQRFSSCSNSYIEVDEMSILCSTPGQYYYGNSFYRNSATCQGSDRANYEIELNIPNKLPENYVPYITVDVKGYGTVEDMRVLDSEKFCDLEDLWSLDGGECPEPGRYQVSSKFYWGEQDDEYSYNFRPHMVIGLSSSQGAKKYDLGGANTDSCEHGSFTNWSTRVQRSVSNTLHTFVITLGILLGAVILVYSGSWFINRRYQKQKQEKKVLNEEAAEDGEDYVKEEDIQRI